MKVNANVVKDLSYQQMIYNKLLEEDSRFAALFPYTNITQDVLQGGTRAREHPLPGIAMNTYEPSTLSVGGRVPRKGLKGRKMSEEDIRPAVMPRPAVILPPSLKGGNNRIEIVKKIMKEQGLNLPQASKYVKEHNLYQKLEKAVGAGNKSGKISRHKKGTKWRDFSNDTVRMGIDTAAYGYKEYQKAKNPIGSKLKSIVGGGEDMEGAGNKSGKISRHKKGTKWRDFSNDTVRMGIDTAAYGYKEYQKAKNPIGSKLKSMVGGGASPWISFVKDFASKNGLNYKEALKQAGPAYKQLKGN